MPGFLVRCLVAALPLLAKQRPKNTKNPSWPGTGMAFRWERAVPPHSTKSRGEVGGPLPGAAVAGDLQRPRGGTARDGGSQSIGSVAFLLHPNPCLKPCATGGRSLQGGKRQQPQEPGSPNPVLPGVCLIPFPKHLSSRAACLSLFQHMYSSAPAATESGKIFIEMQPFFFFFFPPALLN